jgi:hypothetical protein
MNLTKIETPEDFAAIIPKQLEANIQFRKELHGLLTEDTGLRKVYLEMCYALPKIFFDTSFWTFNPKNKPGYRNVPFILRPMQEEVIAAIKNSIDNGCDLLIDKSRDEGATELITKFFAFYWLVLPSTMFLVGSRNENYVDKSVNVRSNHKVTGDHKCLFHKVLYGIANLPQWLYPTFEKTHLHLENVDNGAIIDGETTTENFGAGDRRTAILLDEFGRVEHRIAQSIRETVSDVSDSVIYNSTHFYGRGHPYAKLRFSNKISVITLPWHKNPEKNKGLYRSPDLNMIELLDIDYYANQYPKVFQETQKKFYKYSEMEKDFFLHYPNAVVSFIADGGDKQRSPWYDAQEQRRDPRDMAQNIDMNPAGAGDQFFDMVTLTRLRNEKIREPEYKGEVRFKLNDRGKIASYKFVNEDGLRRFKWWGELIMNRPRQDHNYILAVDISLGSGASNSTIGVYDVNTYEKIGQFACPNTPPESLADQAVAIGYWVGGKTEQPYMVWEANGPGNAFDKRIKTHGYKFIYTTTNERAKHRTKRNTRGWYSTGGPNGTKYDLLLQLRMALSEGLKSKPVHKALIVYDEATIGEYEDYIFYENGDIGLSSCIDEETGAKSAHGDRVIIDGMAVLAMGEQPKAVLTISNKAKKGSLAYRRIRHKRQEEQENSRFIF